MAPSYDLVIRNGRVVDGSGGPAREPGTADVAVDGDRIVDVGPDVGPGRREIDADGRLVTPGFVDIHTHYDGQATWDPEVSPSSWHGVTTIVMGNCGVGFAPADPAKRDWLIQLMEGVEDIPGTALAEGIDWQWESFPEYLDAIERMPRAIDVAAQVPHGAVRAYVMGERGAKNEASTPDDVAAMARIVREALAAGALGFSTSRTLLHRAIDGEPVPGTFANEQELLGIGRALGGTRAFDVRHHGTPPRGGRVLDGRQPVVRLEGGDLTVGLFAEMDPLPGEPADTLVLVVSRNYRSRATAAVSWRGEAERWRTARGSWESLAGTRATFDLEPGGAALLRLRSRPSSP